MNFRSRLFVFVVALAAISVSLFLFSNPSQMSVNWTFPYFSGAANFERLFDWRISPSDYEVASRLGHDEYLEYKHQATTETVDYGLNSYGYVLIALLSRLLFFWLGDIQAVIYLQVLVHLIISFFFIYFVFRDSRSRLWFVFLYAANPLVVYFVTFPFYYFWLCLPSVCFATLLLRPLLAKVIVPFSVPLLLISLLIRPTTIFLCLLFFAVSFKYLSKTRISVLVPSLGLFVAGVIFMSSVNPRMPPWHTMYIGFGAYSNTFEISSLSDNEGYRYFTKKTGVSISTNPVSGNWGNVSLMKDYNNVLRTGYFQILASSPLTVLKNAALNFGQVFSLGFLDGRPMLSLLSSFAGWAFLVYLLLRGQWMWALAIFASSLSFFWYFPPIPAYNFAAYLLLACGFIASLPHSHGDLAGVVRSKG